MSDSTCMYVTGLYRKHALEALPEMQLLELVRTFMHVNGGR
jgi:hypothetical protein